MVKKNNEERLIANNSRATYDYSIEETYEAGIVLTGTEVKSLRRNKATLGDSYAIEANGEIILHNLHIAEYTEANRFNHYPKRPRKLLLNRREIRKIVGVITRKKMTLIPLKMYFNKRNFVKVLIATALGKKKYDKRESIKCKEWNREKARVMSKFIKGQ